MKKITLFSFLLFFCIIGFSQDIGLVGKWKNTTEQNYDEQYEFKKDKTAYMIKEGITSPPFKYEFDANKTPNWVDLSVDEDDFKMTMLGLIEFIDQNTVKLELFPETEEGHPAQFSTTADGDDGTYIILKRI